MRDRQRERESGERERDKRIEITSIRIDQRANIHLGVDYRSGPARPGDWTKTSWELRIKVQIKDNTDKANCQKKMKEKKEERERERNVKRNANMSALVRRRSHFAGLRMESHRQSSVESKPKESQVD